MKTHDLPQGQGEFLYILQDCLLILQSYLLKSFCNQEEGNMMDQSCLIVPYPFPTPTTKKGRIKKEQGVCAMQETLSSKRLDERFNVARLPIKPVNHLAKVYFFKKFLLVIQQPFYKQSTLTSFWYKFRFKRQVCYQRKYSFSYCYLV